MLKSHHAVYIGKKSENDILQFFNTSHFFLVLQITEQPDKEENIHIAQELGKNIVKHEVRSLVEFEQIISQEIKTLNLPLGLSLSAGYLKDNAIFYLKTIGAGVILLKRDKEVATIISSDNSASGYVKEGDNYILTTVPFTTVLSQNKLKDILSANNLEESVQKINREINEDKGGGLIAFFIKVIKEDKALSIHKENEFVIPEGHKNKPKLASIFQGFYFQLQSLRDASKSRNKITIAVIVILFLILTWSVVFGYKRRVEAETQRKIYKVKELINQKLSQSEEIAFLNMSRAQVLMSEARTELENLKAIISDKNRKEILELENLIKTKEESVVKREEKTPEEFYDLTLDNKNAKGNLISSESEYVVIIDKDNEKIYLLSTINKSLEKKSLSKLSVASLIGISDSDIFFFVNNDGLYKFSDQDSIKKVVENDKDWGTIKDMVFYNGNIYLLDSGRGQVHKYLIVEDGYGQKQPYVKSEISSLSEASSLAIDSSLYVSLADSVIKFTAGEQDAFQTEYPEQIGEIKKVMTNKDVEKVYVWDKEKGVVYVLGKNGTYERQIKSGILSNADDLTLIGDKIFVLVKEKLYTLGAE